MSTWSSVRPRRECTGSLLTYVLTYVITSPQGRAATGVQLQKLDPNDYVASVAIVPAEFGRSSEDGPKVQAKATS